MHDHATETLPRIALVFGDEAAVVHVREAMTGHADVVYAAPAAEFDVSHQVSAGATATLVNLDDIDWLDDIETKLDAAGVAVVYNDPEISQKLEGWERARWLRHLVAKLRGSSDVDPPRPEAPSPSMPAPGDEAVAQADEFSVPPVEGAMVERPLSQEEIETMTVDFVSEPKPVPAQTVEAAVPTAVADAAAAADVPSRDLPEQVVPATPSVAGEPAPELPAEPMLAVDAQPAAAAAKAEADPAALDFDAETGLDVDTETLSAMIDARLAEADASDSPEVWREVSGDVVSPAQPDEVVAVEEKVQPEAAPDAAPADTASDDADVLAGLPSLDDWQLVDSDDAVPAPAATNGNARKTPEPVLSDAFAGLELVPMETVAPLKVDADPIERWFGGQPGKKPAVANDAEPGVGEASHGHG